jgi:hypothetical protein
VWPAFLTGSATLTLIQPELTLNDAVAVSVLPPTVTSLIDPVIAVLEPGFTQMETVSVSPTVTVVFTLWLTVVAPFSARSYLPPRAAVVGPSIEAPDTVQPVELPSNDGELRAIAVPAGAAGSAEYEADVAGADADADAGADAVGLALAVGVAEAVGVCLGGT